MPTTKQMKAIHLLATSQAPTVKDAMLQAGYAPTSAKVAKLTQSKAYREVVEKYLPDELLAERHQYLLNKREVKVRAGRDGVPEVVDTGELDAEAVKAGLEMAYRIKGYLKSDAVDVSMGMFQNLTDEELQIIAFGRVVDVNNESQNG